MHNLNPNYGYLERGVGAAPAAGAELTYTFPGGRRYRVMAITLNLTTAVAVANRHVSLQLAHGGGAAWNAFAPVIQLASLTYTYVFNADGCGIVLAVNGWVAGVLPNNFTVQGTDVISTVTANLQAADQFSSMLLFYESWVENG